MMHLFDWQLQKQGLISVADLGEGPGPPPPPLFWVKNKRESQKEEKPKGKGTKNPPILPQLKVWIRHCICTYFSLRYLQ